MQLNEMNFKMNPNKSTAHNKESNTMSDPAAPRISIILNIIITGIQVIIAAITYPFLPDRIPIHWNFAGQIDGYGDKFWGVFLWPLISIGIFLLIRLSVWLGPQLGSDNRQVNLSFADRLNVALALLFLAFQLVIIAAGFHMPVDIIFIVNTLLGALFIFIGNYLGKIRRNFWVGIRTPWTLVSDVSWERTHRMGGWLFVAVGVLILILEFAPGITMRSLLALLIIPAVAWLVVYSYLVYRQEQQHTH
jgi:uncharacterized membrane protein